MRLLDRMVNGVQEIRSGLERLRREGYTAEDVGRAARDVAALSERILKAAEPRWVNQSLNNIVNSLESLGWDGAAALHTIRRVANADKHESDPDHDMTEVVEAVTQLARQAPSLADVVPNIMMATRAAPRRRQMVCAIYDFFAQGETCYLFFAASPDDTYETVQHIDGFEVSAQSSKAVEQALEALDGWVWDPPELAELRASLETSDQELWRIASFTASYEDVLNIVAPHQHNLPLLGGLHREDEIGNTVASIAHAVLYDEPPVLSGRNRMEEEEIERPVREFIDGLPSTQVPVRIDRVGAEGWPAARNRAIAVDERLGLLVLVDGTLLVRS